MGAVIVSLLALSATREATRSSEEANRRTQQLTRQGQITDRYRAAVEQLGHPIRIVRVGAVYTLERLMRDSESDQPTIVEVLFGFIRDAASIPCDPNGGDHPATDVQAALTVLANRDSRLDQGRTKPDLNRTCLIGADLTGGPHAEDLTGRPRGVDFTGVNLTYTDLTCANLTNVHLDQATMASTSMGDATLRDATLTSATMTDTVLNDADLRGAILRDATMLRVDLTRVKPTPAQVMALVKSHRGTKLDTAPSAGCPP
jgi:Pentapeptide repeats (8 copies)